jgi:hypothetical protein
LTCGFCIRTWHHIGQIQKALGQKNSLTEASKATNAKVTAQRLRLLKIAATSCVCLLLNAVATLTISEKLGDWSRSTELYLNCEINETWLSRNLKAYGFEGANDVMVCTMGDSITVQQECVSDCFYAGLSGPKSDFQFLDFSSSLACLHRKYDNVSLFIPTLGSNACDCPCSALAPIVRPSVAITIVPYVAQSLVVSVVALNMGFRYAKISKPRSTPFKLTAWSLYCSYQAGYFRQMEGLVHQNCWQINNSPRAPT